MSIFDDIKISLSQVPGLLGQTWQYRKRTSDRDQADAFGSWVDVDALALDHLKESEDIDMGSNEMETISVRVPSNSPIAVGDQMKDVDGVVWHVKRQISSGIGTNRFSVTRAHRGAGGDQRGGGF